MFLGVAQYSSEPEVSRSKGQQRWKWALFFLGTETKKVSTVKLGGNITNQTKAVTPPLLGL